MDKFINNPELMRKEHHGRSVRFRITENDNVYVPVSDIMNLLAIRSINMDDVRANCASLAKISYDNAPIFSILTSDITELCETGHGRVTDLNKRRIDWVHTQAEGMIEGKRMLNVSEPEDGTVVEAEDCGFTLSDRTAMQIFNNPQFGEVRVIKDKNGEPWFCLADICRAVGLTNPRDVKTRLKPDYVQLVNFQVVSQADVPHNIGNPFMNFVSEYGLYDTLLYSSSPSVEPFRRWVVEEVLPSIRKYGAYITPSTLEQAICNPDFLIQIAMQLKEEQAKRKEAEAKRLEAEEKCKAAEQESQRILQHSEYQRDVIEGLTSEISLADMRQRINEIMRHGGVSGIRDGFRMLYSEFEKKYHMNLSTRMNNVCYKGSKMDYIDNELNMIPELYEMACKLFESDYEDLMKSWGRTMRTMRRPYSIPTNR